MHLLDQYKTERVPPYLPLMPNQSTFSRHPCISRSTCSANPEKYSVNIISLKWQLFFKIPVCGDLVFKNYCHHEACHDIIYLVSVLQNMNLRTSKTVENVKRKHQAHVPSHMIASLNSLDEYRPLGGFYLHL